MTSPHGIMAEFARPDDLVAAIRAAKDAGYTRIEAFSPFPLREAAQDLGVRTAALPWIALAAGLIGAAVQYATQVGLNVIDYPLNVGGRPLHSWPAFIPATLLVAVLWTGAATLIGMLALIGLPRLHHPVFEVPGFERASEDRFFLLILADDPRFEAERVAALLHELTPLSVREAPGCA